jgi:hypothetical protein
MVHCASALEGKRQRTLFENPEMCTVLTQVRTGAHSFVRRQPATGVARNSCITTWI